MASLNIEQDLARRLLLEGGTFVFLGVPEGTEFGIDMKSWNTAGDFRGIKMIPPGIHFIHYSAVSKNTGDVAPRVGFLHNFRAKDFIVRMWNKDTEDLSKDNISEESVQKLKDNLLNLDRFLAPYPYDIHEKWRSLSSNITDSLVVMLTPENGRISSALELISCDNNDRPKGKNRPKAPDNEIKGEEDISCLPQCSTSTTTAAEETKLDETSDNLHSEPSCSDVQVQSKRRSRPSTVEEKEEALLPHLKPAPGMALRLTEFPERNYPENATPSEITKHSLDQTYVLEHIIKRHERPIDVIGELEFAYICFLVGHSLDAFEQWKKLVKLICSCEEAIKKYRNVYLQFITSLEIQITEIPEEFLADIVMNNNLIYIKLRDFFRTVYNSDVEDRLKTAIDRFKDNLTEKFMWDFSDIDEEDDDERPVVVKLPK